MTYLEQVNQLTSQYNEAIRALEDSYNWENTQAGWNLTSSYLAKQYSNKYDVLAREYHQKHHLLLESYKISHPEWAKRRRMAPHLGLGIRHRRHLDDGQLHFSVACRG